MFSDIENFAFSAAYFHQFSSFTLISLIASPQCNHDNWTWEKAHSNSGIMFNFHQMHLKWFILIIEIIMLYLVQENSCRYRKNDKLQAWLVSR